MPHVRSPEKQKERRKKYKTFIERKAEQDTIRGVFKDNCNRDLLTGEIAYDPKHRAAIQQALVDSQYRTEKTYPSKNVHVKGRTEKEWHNVDTVLAAGMLDSLVEGEVLNRASCPCWWLSVDASMSK
jgi:hypothetical protein